MALPIKSTKINTIEGIDTFYNGGKGSGNFGHAGRPGEVGGSGSGIGSSDLSDEVKSIVRYEHERAQRGGFGMSTYEKCKELAKKIGLGENVHDGAGIIQDYAWSKHLLQEHQLYLKNPKRSSAGEKAYQAELPVLKERIAKHEKAIKEAIKKTQIHQKYLDQGLSNIQEKTVAKQEEKIKALRKIKIEYKDAISKVGKEELAVMSRLDKQEKDAVEYLEKLKKIESSKRKTNGVKIKKELYNELKKRVDALGIMLNGGRGSGNFGHAGRPGEVGGSGKGGASQVVSDGKGGDGSKYGKYSRAKTYTHTGVMRHTADGRIVTDSDYEPEVYRDIAKAQGVAQTIGEESYTGLFDGIDGTAKDVGEAQAVLALDLERVGEHLLDAGNTKGGSLEQHLKDLDNILETADDHFAQYEVGIAHGQRHDIENLAGGTPKQIKGILARDKALREAYRTMKRCVEKAHQLKPNYTDEAYYKDIDITDVWKD